MIPREFYRRPGHWSERCQKNWESLYSLRVLTEVLERELDARSVVVISSDTPPIASYYSVYDGKPQPLAMTFL